MDKIFQHKTVIISGGMGDIGRAMAIEFARHGANVAMCGSRPVSVATEFLKLLKQYPVSCTYSQVDIADAQAVQDWVVETEKTLGVSSLIIANAATVTLAGINEVTPEQWSRELRVNLDGAFYLTRVQHHVFCIINNRVELCLLEVGQVIRRTCIFRLIAFQKRV
jgi:glucose 1-dehydrogenase